MANIKVDNKTINEQLTKWKTSEAERTNVLFFWSMI